MTKVYFQSVFNTTKTQKLQHICIKTAKKKKKQTIKQEISILLFHHTFDVNPFRRFLLTHLPNAWFLLYLWDSCTRLLLILISTKSRMIILRPYSGDFTHNSLCPQKVLGAGKSVSMPLCQAFVDFPYR